MKKLSVENTHDSRKLCLVYGNNIVLHRTSHCAGLNLLSW